MLTFPIDTLLSKVSFNEKGLVPVIVQREGSDEILMMAWMNQESLTLTLQSRQMIYWSRSRNTLWKKGETSGHTQALKALYLDCDGDTLLAKVEQVGAACHTGNPNCFFQEIKL